jgi:hypothetical protein
MYHKKYEFDSKEQFETLKLDVPHMFEKNQNDEDVFVYTCQDLIVILDELPLSEPELDEFGNIVGDVEWSGKYHVDALWMDEANEPDSWKEYFIQLDNVGVHGFAGVNYIENN